MLRRAVSATLAAACLVLASTSAAHACAGADRSPSRIGPKRAAGAVRCLIGQQRAAHGLGGVRPVRSLRRAAAFHLGWMLSRGVFSHQVPGEPALQGRLRRVGYHRRAGEVLAWGKGSNATPRSTVAGWMASPAHRAILLDGRMHHIGISMRRRAPGVRGRAATYVAVLGG